MQREISFRVRDLARNRWLEEEDTSLHCFTAYFLSLNGQVKAVDGALSEGNPCSWSDLKWIEYKGTSLGVVKPEDRFVIQQFTGAKDKNGKKIYEGDIVNVNQMNRTIMWRGSGFYCTWSEYALDTCWFMGGGPEVVGNIFDNPELVKE